LRLRYLRRRSILSKKDEATREALASELGELKNKYSQLEQAYSELKHQVYSNQPEGQPSQQGQTS